VLVVLVVLLETIQELSVVIQCFQLSHRLVVVVVQVPLLLVGLVVAVVVQMVADQAVQAIRQALRQAKEITAVTVLVVCRSQVEEVVVRQR
jgi:hypothetical protein